jgi:hypothetical protein
MSSRAKRKAPSSAEESTPTAPVKSTHPIDVELDLFDEPQSEPTSDELEDEAWKKVGSIKRGPKTTCVAPTTMSPLPVVLSTRPATNDFMLSNIKVTCNLSTFFISDAILRSSGLLTTMHVDCEEKDLTLPDDYDPVVNKQSTLNEMFCFLRGRYQLGNDFMLLAHLVHLGERLQVTETKQSELTTAFLGSVPHRITNMGQILDAMRLMVDPKIRKKLADALMRGEVWDIETHLPRIQREMSVDELSIMFLTKIKTDSWGGNSKR